jgi:hypothetical protein
LWVGLLARHAEPTFGTNRTVITSSTVFLLCTAGSADPVYTELAARAVLVDFALWLRGVISFADLGSFFTHHDLAVADIEARGARFRASAVWITGSVNADIIIATIGVGNAGTVGLGDADLGPADLTATTAFPLGAGRGALAIEAFAASSAVLVKLTGFSTTAILGAYAALSVYTESGWALASDFA